MNDDPTAPPRKALDAATAHSPATQWLLVEGGIQKERVKTEAKRSTGGGKCGDAMGCRKRFLKVRPRSHAIRYRLRSRLSAKKLATGVDPPRCGSADPALRPVEELHR